MFFYTHFSAARNYDFSFFADCIPAFSGLLYEVKREQPAKEGGNNMNKKNFDRKNSYHKHKNHSGCQFFYDSNSIHKENHTMDPFNTEDFDMLEEKEFKRRCKRMRYHDRHSSIEG